MLYRCGGLRDVDGEMVDRCNVDMVKNKQGEMLVECMKRAQVYALSMIDRDQMSLPVSPVKDDRSMVDYCLVPCEEVANVENFIVRTMSHCEAHLCTSEAGLRVSDNSVIMWDLWGG